MSIGRNTAIGMATDATVFVLGIAVSIVLTRSFGPQQRGIYATLIITNAVLTALGHLSVLGAFSTYLARGRYRPGEANGVALLLALVMGALAFAVASLAYPLLRDSIFLDVRFDQLAIALLIIPATIYQVYWNYIMMGLNRIVQMNKLNLAVNLVSAVAQIIAVGVLRLGLPGFLAVWATVVSGGALVAFAQALRLEPLVWPPSRRALRDLVGFGLRSHGANVAHQLFLRFDAYAVKGLVGTRALGFYSLSTSLAEKLWLPMNAIQASSIGKIAQLPHDESALLTAKITRTALLMMIGIGLPFAVISPWLIPFLYGAEFEAAVLPLVILTAGTVAFAVMMVINNYIQGQMERPGLLSIISWLELGVSIPLYLIFITWLGIVGAAIASTLTYMLAMVATVTIFLRDSRLPLRAVLLPTAADFGDYVRVMRRGLNRLRPAAR